MAYEVLARKWRPQVFEDVIGQEHVTQTLINAIKTDRLAHAYLFSGARGVGKTSIARILAKAINCAEGEPGIPCNHCPSCEEITNGSSVDVQEIDGASNRGIDEIRELRENIKYMPSASRYRVYIIDEVHMLTLQAFNALLKTLEEPPPHVKFIFATTEPHKVPVTILSRCQRFDFKRIPMGKIADHLGRITAQEGIDIRPSGLALIAREAEGSMRDAQSLLDQVIAYTGHKVEDKNITDILGVIDRELLFEMSRAVIEGDAEKCIRIVNGIYNYGYDLKEFYRGLMDQFRNLLVGLISSQDDLIDVTDRDLEEIRHQAELAGRQKLQQALSLLIAREEDLRYTAHPRLVLETILVKLCDLGEILSFDDLIGKIENLEKRLGPAAVADLQDRVGRLSDPGMAWQPREEATPPPAQEWDRFIQYLSTKNGAMANVLKALPLVNATRDMAEISRGDNAFASTYLDDPERYDKLAAYCRNFFKRAVKIKLVGPVPKSTEKDTVPGKGNPAPSAKQRTDLPPPVQNVLDIFQGEVKEEIPVDEPGTLHQENSE